MKFRASETFWRNFYELSSRQKESARRAWKIFKENPFDPRLRTHKIHQLSALYAAVEMEANLRVVFYMDREMVRTIDIGTHEIYQA